MGNKNLSNVKSKVKPPRLDGAKVGLFSTRTPHRPNAIGLSVAKVEGLDEKGALILSGIDLLDGTPILDVKPYVREYDSLPEAVTAEWIQTPKVESFKRVEWNPSALDTLNGYSNQLDLYAGNPKALQNAIEQVVHLDIRTVHERQNKSGNVPDLSHAFRIDNLLVEFVVEGDVATIKKIRHANAPKGQK
eukprot:TRINITY_DN5740_c0_g1_i1.p1 TRINITY_DN5740_c0_g1~~TRINITY_DN5740_c0_g1_i1.p1  ORF type:complete len:190 (-),score=87.08 TRINITY_DN5740_c0_g1_i1:12-581(-)